MRRTILALFLLVLSLPRAFAVTPLDDLPANKELVDPFTFNDGHRVANKADWEQRREEIKQLLADYEYGHLPPAPKSWDLKDDGKTVDEATGVVTLRFAAKFIHENRDLTMHIRVVLPKGTDKVPVLIQPSFGPLRPSRPDNDTKPAWPDPALQVVERGYAFVDFPVADIVPDNRDTARDGEIYTLYGKDIDCGALMAWAWGFHRVVDVLEDVGRIDSDKIVVTGHSRYGKAALVAGAFDDRIAVTAPSHSGCGGAAPYRFIYGKSEQLHNIVGAFPYWFRPDFNQFVDHVDQLPVDQHLLLAAVAPRALLPTEGTEDYWINPEGSQLTYLAAKEVYKFLGASDKISIHFRKVAHIPNNDDVLDFADHVFFAKPLSREFGKLPYPVAKNGYSWSAPKE